MKYRNHLVCIPKSLFFQSDSNGIILDLAFISQVNGSGLLQKKSNGIILKRKDYITNNIYIYIYIRNKTIYYILHSDGRGRVLFSHLEVVLKFH